MSNLCEVLAALEAAKERTTIAGRWYQEAGLSQDEEAQAWTELGLAREEQGRLEAEASLLRAEMLREQVEAKCSPEGVRLYREMIEQVRGLKQPAPLERVSLYEEAVAHRILRREGLGEIPFENTTAYHMGRNAGKLVQKEPALSRVKRLSRESDPVKYLFCLEIRAMEALGLHPRPNAHYSKFEVVSWYELKQGADAFMKP